MGYCCDICKVEVFGQEDSATVWIGAIDGIVENIEKRGITQRELDAIQSRLICNSCMGEEISRNSISGTKQFKARDYFVNLLKNTGFIKKEKEDGNAYKENRIGVFCVSEEVFRDGLDVSCLFKNMIVVRAKHKINQMGIEYTAYSHMFDKVDVAVMPLRYELSILVENGNKVLVVKKIDNEDGKEKTYIEKRIDAITGGIDLSTGRRFNV